MNDFDKKLSVIKIKRDPAFYLDNIFSNLITVEKDNRNLFFYKDYCHFIFLKNENLFFVENHHIITQICINFNIKKFDIINTIIFLSHKYLNLNLDKSHIETMYNSTLHINEYVK